jgi:CMP-N,N'-diacetyllegionaminic acid synthase
MNIFLGAREKKPPSSIVAIVPARAGSKGLPSKNLLKLGGLPLVEHSIRLALAVREFDYVVVTTDSSPILELRTCYPNVIFIARPGEISGDDSSIADAVIHVFHSLDVRIGERPAFAILQPTSPFRSPADISSAVSFSFQCNVSSLMSVVKMSQNPSECLKLVHGGWRFLEPSPGGSARRQDYLDAYFITGSFYYATLNALLGSPQNCFSSASLWLSSDPLALDIDTPFEFELASILFSYMTRIGYTFVSDEWSVRG